MQNLPTIRQIATRMDHHYASEAYRCAERGERAKTDRNRKNATTEVLKADIEARRDT